MAQELVFNGALLLFFIYCFFYVGSTAPDSIQGELSGAQYPQILIVLLVICIGVNIFKIVKNKKNEESFKISFNLSKFFKNKMTIGSILLIAYSFILDYIGFIFGSLIFFMAYSRLLGQKKIGKLILSAVVCVVLLYIIFDGVLDIMLPRGTGIFRTFALFIESLF
jgi:hypothetical protein